MDRMCYEWFDLGGARTYDPRDWERGLVGPGRACTYADTSEHLMNIKR
jgi:hypothetical protein